ncbi:MAG TPA: heavy metal-binding domain-containing protein [Opitutaceae bacterium]
MPTRPFKNARVAAALVAAAACGLLPSTPRAAAADDKKAGEEKKYTCPMHPEISADKPGKCPQCGMDLVEKKKT